MTSRLVSIAKIGSTADIRDYSLQFRERCPSFHPLASRLKIASSKKTTSGLKCSGASFAWKSIPAANDLGRVLVLTPSRRWSFADKASGSRDQGDNAPSYSIPIIFKFILDIFEAIFKLSRTLWALYTKEKSILDEIEENVEKASEMVQETAKVVENAAESVENISKVIAEDAKKVDSFLEKMKDSPGNMEQAAEFVSESAKLVEDVAERVEKLSKVVKKDAEKASALAEKVDETTKIVIDDIDEVFGSLGSSGENTTKPGTKDATSDRKRETEATDTNRNPSNTSSSLIIADWSAWNPWRSFVQTLVAGDYLDAGMGRILTRAFLMAAMVLVVDILMWGGGLGAQRHWLQLLFLRTTLQM